jgi:hypothetical protein
MPRFAASALQTIHRHNRVPELIDFASLSTINATLGLRSGDNARRRCGGDSCSRPDRMVRGFPCTGRAMPSSRSPTMGEGLKVLFTNVPTTARSAAEGDSMLVMNVLGRRAQRLFAMARELRDGITRLVVSKGRSP